MDHNEQCAPIGEFLKWKIPSYFQAWIAVVNTCHGIKTGSLKGVGIGPGLKPEVLRL
ncbi:hypothetical protein BDR04DRAFT_1110772, partial [Suillus decipiens]